MVDKWFLAKDKKKVGPFTADDLRQMVSRKSIEPTDMLLQDGATHWALASTLAWLFPNQVVQTGLPTAVLAPPLTNSERQACKEPVQFLSVSHRARQYFSIAFFFFASRPWLALVMSVTLIVIVSIAILVPWILRGPTTGQVAVPIQASQEVADATAKDLKKADSPRVTGEPKSGKVQLPVAVNQTGLIGIEIKKTRGEMLISALTLASPAQLSGLRLGDRLVRVGRTKDLMVEVAEKTEQEVLDLLFGPAGASVWLTYRRGNATEPVDVEIIRRTKFDQNKMVSITWDKTGYFTDLPHEVIERFEGSPRSYQYFQNQSKLLAFPEEYSGKRIAVVTDLLFPEVNTQQIQLRLFEQMDSPLALLDRTKTPKFFEAVVSNDPMKNRFVIMHMRLRPYSNSPKLYGELEEIVFLDEKAPDAYKPLIVNQDAVAVFQPQPIPQKTSAEEKPLPLPTKGAKLDGGPLGQLGWNTRQCLLCSEVRSENEKRTYSDKRGFGFCQSCGDAANAFAIGVEVTNRGMPLDAETAKRSKLYVERIQNLFQPDWKTNNESRTIALILLTNFGNWRSERWDRGWDNAIDLVNLKTSDIRR
jgi:hypothetical protein